MQQTRESWQIVFFIAAAVYTFGAIMYCILGRGTLQPWAREVSKDMYEIEPMQVKGNEANGVNGVNGVGMDVDKARRWSHLQTQISCQRRAGHGPHVGDQESLDNIIETWGLKTTSGQMFWEKNY